VQNYTPPPQSPPPPPPQSPPPPTSPAATGGGFWGKLGGALLEALGEYADRKVDEATAGIEGERRLAAETPDITGQWYNSSGGSPFMITQRGSYVIVQGYTPDGAPVNGEGWIRGKSIEIAGVSFHPAGGPFRANLVVSPDGHTITGKLTDRFNRWYPVQLNR
jgi:hypothetical protein